MKAYRMKDHFGTVSAFPCQCLELWFFLQCLRRVVMCFSDGWRVAEASFPPFGLEILKYMKLWLKLHAQGYIIDTNTRRIGI